MNFTVALYSEFVELLVSDLAWKIDQYQDPTGWGKNKNVRCTDPQTSKYGQSNAINRISDPTLPKEKPWTHVTRYVGGSSGLKEKIWGEIGIFEPKWHPNILFICNDTTSSHQSRISFPPYSHWCDHIRILKFGYHDYYFLTPNTAPWHPSSMNSKFSTLRLLHSTLRRRSNGAFTRGLFGGRRLIRNFEKRGSLEYGGPEFCW